MKIVTTLFVLIVFTLAGYAQQDKKELKNQRRAAQYEQIKELVNSGAFEFIGLWALPQKGSQVDLTRRDNFMTIRDGKASADLPFFGRAFNASIASYDSGIKFAGRPENYRVEENDKKYRLIIKFRMRAKAENFDCSLVISSLENASLTVISTQRSSMTYNGAVGKISTDK